MGSDSSDGDGDAVVDAGPAATAFAVGQQHTSQQYRLAQLPEIIRRRRVVARFFAAHTAGRIDPEQHRLVHESPVLYLK